VGAKHQHLGAQDCDRHTLARHFPRHINAESNKTGRGSIYDCLPQGCPMKIAGVIGVGAMGSTAYCWLMPDTRFGPSIPGTRMSRRSMKGLRVEGASGDRTVNQCARPKNIAGCRGFATCVYPCHQSIRRGPAAQTAASGCQPNATGSWTIQNGPGAGERSRSTCPRQRPLELRRWLSRLMKGTGHAHHNSMKLIRIGDGWR
jgi:2-dehydropantoate 2-reductase